MIVHKKQKLYSIIFDKFSYSNYGSHVFLSSLSVSDKGTILLLLSAFEDQLPG